jgi:hypothetical protein
VLVASGALVDAKDRWGETPLESAQSVVITADSGLTDEAKLQVVDYLTQRTSPC